VQQQSPKKGAQNFKKRLIGNVIHRNRQLTREQVTGKNSVLDMGGMRTVKEEGEA